MSSRYSLPSDPDHASSHQFLDLRPDLDVLHMLLKRRRVTLGLLEDALHDRVLENRHDLFTRH